MGGIDGRAGEDPLASVMPGDDGGLGDVASAEDRREGAFRSVDSFVEQGAQERARSYQQAGTDDYAYADRQTQPPGELDGGDGSMLSAFLLWFVG